MYSLSFRAALALGAILFKANLTGTGAQDDSAVPEADMQSSGASCGLADLFLHSPADGDGNAQPISTQRDPIRPDTFLAQLDYSMMGFDVEARAVPEDRCRLDQMAQSTTMVDPGSTVTVQLLVRDRTLPANSKNSRLYKVQVRRLQGTETDIRVLKIDQAMLLPSWDTAVRNYTAYLDVSQDIVKFIFQRLDNGQVVGLSSSLEEPLDAEGSGRRAQALVDPLAPPIGEVQYLPSTLTSTIDVGRQRMINVVVESADRSAIGRYTFRVQRPFCPEERRFLMVLQKPAQIFVTRAHSAIHQPVAVQCVFRATVIYAICTADALAAWRVLPCWMVSVLLEMPLLLDCQPSAPWLQKCKYILSGML